MTIQNIAGAHKRRTLTLPFGGRKKAQHCANTNPHPLTTMELRHLVAAMVD